MEQSMENQITCPHCQRTITKNLVIDSAANQEGSDTQFLVCECGERITYWQIMAQLRDQKKADVKIRNWFRSLARR